MVYKITDLSNYQISKLKINLCVYRLERLNMARRT